MRQLPFQLVCACVLAAPGRSLIAQTIPDTSTASFHRGEWGVGFILRSNVTDAGVLRFSTPTRAWVLDGSASLDRQSQSGPVTDQTERSTFVSGQFGPRWYHPVTGHATRFLGFGVSGLYAHTEFSGTSSQGTLWSLGAYGEVGMQYMLTRYLGLGWRGTLSASRGQTNNTEETGQGVSSTQRAISYHVGLEAVQLLGTIYF
jgi:hypothetical protein